MKNRITEIDCLKGIVIIAVVSRHVLQYSVNDLGGVIGNVIWAIQMPLFMMISGFLSFKKIEHRSELKVNVIKKTIAYMIPYLSWYYIVDLFILGKFDRDIYEATSNLFYHVDSALWFLWVVYILSLISSISNYILTRNHLGKLRFILGWGFIICMLSVISIIGIFVSISFAGIKYILYYSLFYFFGYFVNVTQLSGSKYYIRMKDILFPVALLVFLGITFNYNLFSESDNLLSISLRLIAGFSGSYVLYVFVNKFKNGLCRLRLDQLGKYTLEIYCTHMNLCGLMLLNKGNSFYSVNGFFNCTISFFMVSVFTILIITVIKSNKYTNLIMYGKGMGVKTS